MADGLTRRSLLGSLAATLAVGACAASPARVAADGPRVVALGYIKDANAALAAGVVPVAIPKPSGLPGLDPWTRDAIDQLGGARPELIEVGQDVPIERLAALRPDVILATGLYSLDRHRERLERIARVVPPITGPHSDPWPETALRVGEILGHAAAARREIDVTRAAIERTRSSRPELAGKTFTFSSYSNGTFWTKNSTEDVIAQSFAQYGMTLAPAVTGLPPAPTQGFSTVSTELIDVLDADLIIVVGGPPGADRLYEREPLFARLPAVRRGAYHPISPIDGQALAFSSVLSERYAARVVFPRLAELLG
ncbi:MAG: ABC transporter substrate-binding protein [Pseudonocardia sp.]